MDKKEIQIEIINTRTENAKTFDIGNGKRRAEICIGALHYKDDYKDEKEQFKDIDLTWVNNKVTKAPYILERVGNKINVLDKKTGKTSSIELDSIGEEKLTAEKSLTDSKTVEIVKDVDVEIIATPDSIRYQTIIKNEKALKDLKYKITGDIPISYSAVDDDGDIVPLITSLSKEGILTESLDTKSFTSERAEKTAIKYPIKIDPTLTIQGSGADTSIYASATTTNYGSETYIRIWSSFNDMRGLVLLPLSSLPAGAVVNSATFSMYYYQKGLNDPVNKTITADKIRRADWVEGQVTWNIYKTGSNWGTAGCSNTTTDVDTSKTATSTVPSDINKWVEFDVKSIIEDAVTNSVDFNIRMGTSGGDSNASAYFYSKEYSTDTSLRPKLVIEYASAASFIPGIMQHNFIPSFLGGR